MSSLNRYIFRQLAGPVFSVVTVTLTGVVWLTQSLRFLDLIINRGLSTTGFLYLTLLLLPGFLTLDPANCGILRRPFCLLPTRHRQRTRRDARHRPQPGQPCRAGNLDGVRSGNRSVQPDALPPAPRVSYVQGHAVRRAPQLRARSRAGRRIQQFCVGCDRLCPPTNDQRRATRSAYPRQPKRISPVTMMAERGKLVMTDDGPRFVMVSGNRQEVDRADGQVSLLYFDQYTLDLGEIASTPGVRWREAGERYLGELFSPGDTADDFRNSDKLRAEGHRRLVTPFYALALAMIALAGVISGEFQRRRRWVRLAAAGAAAVIFELIALGLGPLVTASSGNGPPSLYPRRRNGSYRGVAYSLAPVRSRPRPQSCSTGWRRMRLSWTLSIYLGRQFLGARGHRPARSQHSWSLLFDIIELMRRASGEDISFGVIVGMSLLQMPTLLAKGTALRSSVRRHARFRAPNQNPRAGRGPRGGRLGLAVHDASLPAHRSFWAPSWSLFSTRSPP